MDWLRFSVEVRKDRRNWFVMAFAGWELATLAFPRSRYPWLPDWWKPWTGYFWTWRTHKWKRLVMWLLLGWLVEHAFGEGRDGDHRDSVLGVRVALSDGPDAEPTGSPLRGVAGGPPSTP